MNAQELDKTISQFEAETEKIKTINELYNTIAVKIDSDLKDCIDTLKENNKLIEEAQKYAEKKFECVKTEVEEKITDEHNSTKDSIKDLDASLNIVLDRIESEIKEKITNESNNTKEELEKHIDLKHTEMSALIQSEFANINKKMLLNNIFSGIAAVGVIVAIVLLVI